MLDNEEAEVVVIVVVVVMVVVVVRAVGDKQAPEPADGQATVVAV